MPENTLNAPGWMEDSCKIVMGGLVVGHGRCRLLILLRDMDFRSSTKKAMPKRLTGRVGRLRVLEATVEMAAFADAQVELRLASGAILRQALLSADHAYWDDFVIHGGIYTEQLMQTKKRLFTPPMKEIKYASQFTRNDKPRLAKDEQLVRDFKESIENFTRLPKLT